MSKDKRRVPKLRFPGFTEDWEQRKLGSIGSTYTGLSGKTKEDFGHGEAQYITYLNVFQNTISDITMTDKIEIDTTQNEVKYGDVLFTTSSETPEEVGMSSVWLGDTPNIYLNSFCFGFRPNQKIDQYFLGYSLRAPYMRDKIKILAQGISRYNISKNKVMELEISLPNNEEQKLLGNLLQRIDLIITLHQRKLDNLKLKKKALLQKLFPKNGERYPELRFPGFADAWEQCKLEDICSYQSSSLTINDIDENGQYDLYDANSLIGKTNKGYMETEYITIIKDGAGVGRTRMLPKNTMFLGTMGALTPKNSCLGFLYQLVTSANLGKICTGSTIPHIYFKDYGKLKFYIPSIIEQEVIGKFFNNIDYLVTLHQRKLDHLKLQKKALLQQMFV